MFSRWLRPSTKVPRAQELTVEKPQSYLVLAPHPDDETIGVGGLMAKAAAAGCQVSVAVLTDGSKLPPPAGGASPPAEQLIEDRRQQCRRALEQLGVGPPTFLDAMDSQLSASIGKIAGEVAGLIERTRPTHIFIPHPSDRHRDHRACTPLLRKSLSLVRAPAKGQMTVLGYEVWLPCAPSHCIDVSDVMERKIAALECYRKTFRQVDLLEMAAGLNRYRAGSELLRSGWSEAFELIRV